MDIATPGLRKDQDIKSQDQENCLKTVLRQDIVLRLTSLSVMSVTVIDYFLWGTHTYFSTTELDGAHGQVSLCTKALWHVHEHCLGLLHDSAMAKDCDTLTVRPTTKLLHHTSQYWIISSAKEVMFSSVLVS